MSTVIINIYERDIGVYFPSDGPITQLPIVKMYFD
jgi:hypothetical protein